MELTILHLFPELMSLYGEYANLRILCRHLEVLGVRTTVERASDTLDFSRAGMIYMGAGTERGQKYVLEKISAHAGEIKAAAARGTLLLFTGNAMETLGASITDAKGKVWWGLGLGDFTTIETDKRAPGDVIATSSLLHTPVVGFMNKCSTTSGVAAPLFSALPLGFGNDSEHGPEGYVSGNVFATHITGPILAKNPDFTNLLVQRLFAQNNWPLPQTLPVLPHEREAYEATLHELQKRL